MAKGKRVSGKVGGVKMACRLRGRKGRRTATCSQSALKSGTKKRKKRRSTKRRR